MCHTRVRLCCGRGGECVTQESDCVVGVVGNVSHKSQTLLWAWWEMCHTRVRLCCGHGGECVTQESDCVVGVVGNVSHKPGRANLI